MRTTKARLLTLLNTLGGEVPRIYINIGYEVRLEVPLKNRHTLSTHRKLGAALKARLQYTHWLLMWKTNGGPEHAARLSEFVTSYDDSTHLDWVDFAGAVAEAGFDPDDDALVELMSDHGWEYSTVDDCLWRD